MKQVSSIVLVSAVALAALTVACATNQMVQLSPDTYMIIKEDAAGIFGSMAKLKADVIRQANTFAAKQGKIAIPLAAKEKPVGFGPGQWASFEYQFRVVEKDDPEAMRTSLEPRPDVVIDKTERVSVHGTPPIPSLLPSHAASVTTADADAEVSIESSVPNADVYVDGKFVGNAPLPRYRLAAGTHVIEVKATGFQPWRRELTVAANSPSRVVAQLEKLP